MKYITQLILIISCCYTYSLKIKELSRFNRNLKVASSSVPNSELTRPKWASGGLLSDFVNLLISTKPIYNIMKIGARNTLISTAEKNGN